MRNKVIFLFIVFAALFFRFFISTQPFVAHDWPLLFSQSRNFSPFYNISWDYTGNGGIGGSAFKTLWIDLYTSGVYAVSNSINIPWWFSQRIFWILPFLIISLYSSYIFSGLFIKRNILKGISSITYTFNTYILLIVGGGQFGIAFAYALLPLAFYLQIKFFNKFDKKSFVKSSIASGILLALDPRIAILEFTIAFFWYLIFIKDYSLSKLKLIILSFGVVALLNSYWILPIILTPGSLSSISKYSSMIGVKFLSFANFSNSLSLLHPNWPENIFGKVYFFRPEFLLIPLLAFSVLFFKNKKEIIFFAVLALVSVFLGKGANDPFGQVYSFLFNLPIFGLFRDSTKFFALIALSYSILIPVFLEKLSRFKNISILLFLIYWLFILKPAWNGQLNGIFKPNPVPRDYVALNQKLTGDKSFYRTLWIPQREKYGYFDPNHPAINAQDFLDQTDFSKILQNLKKPQTQNLIEEAGAKYAIVPYDVDSEIFLSDRRYSKKIYQKTINDVQSIKWLKRIRGFGKIAVFEVPNPKNHFWSSSENLKVSYRFINPADYKVNVQNAEKGDILVFSEEFDKNWFTKGNGFNVQSKPFNKLLNSFKLPRSGNYSLEVYYTPQKWINFGLVISLLTFLSLLFYLALGMKNARISLP